MNQFDLNQLFFDTWGYAPTSIKISDPDGSKNVRIPASGELRVNSNNLVNRKSQAGKYGEYYKQDIKGRMVFMPVTLDDVFLPYTWVSIAGSKRIIETVMTERRGTVNEIIQTEDYRISIKGFFIGHDGQFPVADIEKFRGLWEKNKSISLECIVTDIFLLSPEHNGNDKVIIKNFDLVGNQGIEHVRGFEMELKTDQIFELELV